MQNINYTTATKAELKAAGIEVKSLKARKARKGETHYTAPTTRSTGRVTPQLTEGTKNDGRGKRVNGLGWIGNQCGIGATATKNLERVKKTYAAQVKADRRAAAIDRRNG